MPFLALLAVLLTGCAGPSQYHNRRREVVDAEVALRVEQLTREYNAEKEGISDFIKEYFREDSRYVENLPEVRASHAACTDNLDQLQLERCKDEANDFQAVQLQKRYEYASWPEVSNQFQQMRAEGQPLDLELLLLKNHNGWVLKVVKERVRQVGVEYKQKFADLKQQKNIAYMRIDADEEEEVRLDNQARVQAISNTFQQAGRNMQESAARYQAAQPQPTYNLAPVQTYQPSTINCTSNQYGNSVYTNCR